MEKRYRDGEYKGYGRVLAAHFTNTGTTYEAYLFRDGKNRPQHYNAKGENLRKTLLQAPLAFTRVTSRFSHNRKHPILGYSRPHLGVDYGAPTGTPVKAVGDGVVTRRSWAGGYGNQVIIKHSAGLESMYSHLSGYAAPAQRSARAPGQVIGFVGARALSSGPHLDFRLRQNGKFVNPAKAINPRGERAQGLHGALPQDRGKRNVPCCWARPRCWNMMWTASCPWMMWSLPPSSGHDVFGQYANGNAPCHARGVRFGKVPL